MLAKNQIAPNIVGTSISDQTIDLSEMKGKRVLVKFHRFSGCPVAQRQVKEFINQQVHLNEEGIETIVILQSKKEKIIPVYKEVKGLYILPDGEEKFYKMYDTQFSMMRTLSPATWAEIFKSFFKGYFPRFNRFVPSIHAIPSDFLLDSEGKIVDFNYGTNAGDSWSVHQVLGKIKASDQGLAK